jgi:hypothetical protein
VRIPGCETGPCGNRPCDTWTINNFPNPPLDCEDTWTPFLELTVVAPPLAVSLELHPWICGYGGTYLLSNASYSKCQPEYRSVGVPPLGPRLIGGEYVRCSDVSTTSSPYRWKATVSNNNYYKWWTIVAYYQDNALQTTTVKELHYRTEYQPRQSQGGKGLDCKGTYKAAYYRTTDSQGRLIWSPITTGPGGFPSDFMTIRGL